MEINKKRYNDLDSYYKRKYHKKIIKLPIDGGFSCPNREDGKMGCLFCSDLGAGEWTKNLDSINKQIEYQKKRLSKASREEAYIGYFQNFTSTYGDIDHMRDVFYQALANEDITGLSIATRADCLSDEVLELLDELNHKTDLDVELGMQTINDRTLRIINRGYSHETFNSNLDRLINLGIKVTVHIIVGLPYEDEKDYLANIYYLNEKKIFAIKIHNLYIEKNSRISNYYKSANISYNLSLDEYIETIVKMLRLLKNSIVISRLTGDGIRENIAFPVWSKNKAKVLTSIDKIMKDRDLRQGDLWKEK